VEPVIANVGVIPPDPGVLEFLRGLTESDGALLIFDEVITGFRLAKGGAQELFSIKPDITTMGKIIGGGMPVGAYGGRADLMRLIAPEGPVYQAGTLSGHPIAMAAGIATLDLLTPALYAGLERAGARLEDGLRAAAADAGRQVAISRVGSLLTVFFRATPPCNGAEALASDREAFARFFGAMLDEGVLLPPSQFEAWFLGAEHTDAEIDATVAAARKAFRA
jgi:glutamate-1-semialdehyde 2,1-aminomutase